jgi:hypothetical protein
MEMGGNTTLAAKRRLPKIAKRDPQQRRQRELTGLRKPKQAVSASVQHLIIGWTYPGLNCGLHSTSWSIKAG